MIKAILLSVVLNIGDPMPFEWPDRQWAILEDKIYLKENRRDRRDRKSK